MNGIALYNLTRLCDMALKHIVSILTPTNALSFLLATDLWPELHEAIKVHGIHVQKENPNIFFNYKVLFL